MIAIISPAKTLDYDPIKLKDFTLPVFANKSVELADQLKKKSSKSLRALMGISKNLADLNHQRYQDFQADFNLENSKQAMFAFKGDVYIGLSANDFTKSDIKFAQNSIRILSGLYGILKPLDLMQAYRLEMGTKLKYKRKKNLYEFWGDQITDSLQEDLDQHKKPILVNLASKEYFKSVNKKKLNARILDIDFREYRGDQLKFISFEAKKARGLMCRYMVKNSIKKLDDLKGFNLENYSFSAEQSTDDKWLFVR